MSVASSTDPSLSPKIHRDPGDDWSGHVDHLLNRDSMNGVMVLPLNGLGSDSLSHNRLGCCVLIGLLGESHTDLFSNNSRLDMFLINQELTGDVHSSCSGPVFMNGWLGDWSVVDHSSWWLLHTHVHELSIDDWLDHLSGVVLVPRRCHDSLVPEHSGLGGLGPGRVSGVLVSGVVHLKNVSLDENGGLVDDLNVLFVTGHCDGSGSSGGSVSGWLGHWSSVLDSAWLLDVLRDHLESLSLDRRLVHDTLVDWVDAFFSDHAGLVHHSLGVDLGGHVDSLGVGDVEAGGVVAGRVAGVGETGSGEGGGSGEEGSGGVAFVVDDLDGGGGEDQGGDH